MKWLSVFVALKYRFSDGRQTTCDRFFERFKFNGEICYISGVTGKSYEESWLNRNARPAGCPQHRDQSCRRS